MGLMINPIKIITATILAVLTAQLLKLNFAISAGIVAVLSVQPTKKETLNTAHINARTGTTKKQFCLNDGWAWCRLPNICREKITDGTHNSPPNEKKGDFLYITAKNIKFSGVDLTDVSYVSKEIHDVIYNRCSSVKNDVLLTKDGTIGEATVNNLDYPFSLLSSVALIKTANSILPWYIVYVLKSDYLQKKMIKEAKGTALKRIILDQINSFLVPLPPLNEQKEIVSQVKKNLTLIDSIDKSQIYKQPSNKQNLESLT